MKILHTADWHLGKTLEGYSRIAEQEAFLKDFVDLVEEEKIDLIMIAGDIYDTSNPPAKAENLFYQTLKQLSQKGKRMILVISGNHDSPERLVAARPLAREHGIVMVATPKSVVEVGRYGQNTVVESGEGFIEIEVQGERAVILTVPYPSEKRLNEVLYEEMSEEEQQLEIYSQKIKTLFDNLKGHYRENTINLVMSHLFVMGAEETGSERSIQLGGSFIVEASCFPKEAQYVALGHIHKPMIIPGTLHKVRYAGSPLHYNKKEISFAKGCYILEAKAGQEIAIKEVQFKVYKPIEIWKCKTIEEAITCCKENSQRECWVYLEIETERYITEEEIKEMKSLKKDILEILPKIKSMEETIDTISLSEKSFSELFTTFYKKVRQVEPENELVELLLSITMEEGEKDETY